MVIGIIPLVWEKADGVQWTEGSSPAYVMASMRDTTGVLDQGMRSWGKPGNLREPIVSLQQCKVSGEDSEERTNPRQAIGSLSGT